MTDPIVLSAGPLKATWHPSAGMVCSSLTYDGHEVLGQRGGLADYQAKGSAFGIPLLAPWANRLSALSYTFDDTTVALDPDTIKLSGGLPKDGMLAGFDGWNVVYQSETGLRAEFDTDAFPHIHAAFPFPARIVVLVVMDPSGWMRVTTIVRSTDSVEVPISFGWHPLFTVPGVDRAEVELTAPVAKHALLDDHGIPTGETEDAGDIDGPIGDREFDDLYPKLTGKAPRFALRGGNWTVSITFDRDYPVAQLWSPPGEDFVAIEPMTAPTNALVSGSGLQQLQTGAAYEAQFTVRVEYDDPDAQPEPEPADDDEPREED